MGKIDKQYATEIAKQYNSKIDLKSGNRSVYNYIQTNGLLDELCSHMERKRKWTDQNVRVAAYHYKTRGEFRDKCNAAYLWAKELNLLDELYPPRYTKESVTKIAHSYDYPMQWRDNDRNSYETAKRKGWFDDIVKDMESRRKLWSDDELISVAKKYPTRVEFIKGNKNAYQLVIRRKLQDVCFDHMVTAERFPGDNDAVYIWQALDFTYNGLPVYKIGLTSYRLQDQRVTSVAKAAQTQYNILRIVKTNVPAHVLEGQLLKLGANPKYCDFDGCTEFRALTPQELEKALNLLEKNSTVAGR